MFKQIIFIFMIYKSIGYAEESKYEANYDPLNCKGVVFEYNER